MSTDLRIEIKEEDNYFFFRLRGGIGNFFIVMHRPCKQN